MARARQLRGPRPRKGRISDRLLDELLAGEDPTEAFHDGKLVAESKKALSERILGAEMGPHLDRKAERAAGNHRNGHNRKRALAGDVELDLAAPRDRHGTFEPQLVEKCARRLPGFDEQAISMYGRGMATREIQGRVEQSYGMKASAETISAATETVAEDVREWRSRPLEATCALVFFDALRAKIRDGGLVRNKAACMAIGVTCGGRKEVLGFWIQETEGAKFRLGVMNELKGRGVRDVLIAVADGLKGFPEAIEAAFPQALVPKCVARLIRRSPRYASHKERRELAAALKTICRAATEAAAEAALDAVEDGPWGRKHPAIPAMWRRAWTQAIPFLAFSEPIRRAIYTTNAIESRNSSVRRAVRTRGCFPHDRAAAKLICLALRRAQAAWKRPPRYWREARAEFAIRFGARFQPDDP